MLLSDSPSATLRLQGNHDTAAHPSSLPLHFLDENMEVGLCFGF